MTRLLERCPKKLEVKAAMAKYKGSHFLLLLIEEFMKCSFQLLVF